MSELLAVIRNPKFGLNDRQMMSLRFETWVSENEASTQNISKVDEITKIYKDGNINDTSELEGKLCWVEVDHHAAKFIRMWKYT